MEDNDRSQNHPKQKNGENNGKKPPISNSTLMWYVLGASLIALLLVGLLRSDKAVEIPYGDLVSLIDQGSPAKNPKAAIEIKAGESDEDAEDEAKIVRLSDLSDIQIGPYEITGTVTAEVIAPQDDKTEPEKNVAFHTNRLGLEQDGNALFERLEKNGFTGVRAESPPNNWSSHISMLVLVVLMVVFFIVMMRRLGGPGGAMAFGRSRGKLFAQDDIGITFKDVAGIDEAVEELSEVVEFLKTPEKFKMLGGRIPKGVLLVGPPGTGKTLLAKAVAGEAGVAFFSLSGSDFVEMFVGVGAARVRDMFQQAQDRSPCIVFIDELDALGKTRGNSVIGGHDEREQTLNALLVEMDGFSSNSGVIVMAATNRPETLDPALLRPGRFDRHVLVDKPDIRGREAILKVHIKQIKKIDDSVTLKKVAGITPGFVGADLANLVNEAALLAARKSKETVTMDEFNEGVERVTAGLEKRQRVMHADEKIRIAYHESGHALVAHCLPNTDPVHKVSIIPRGLAALGYTLQRPEGDRYLMTQNELESRVQVLLAGTVAEELSFDDISTGAQNDLQRATEIARSMVMDFGMSSLGRVNYREGSQNSMLGGGDDYAQPKHHSEHTAREIDEEIKRIIDQSLEKVRHILETRSETLVAIAERLVEQEVIDTEELNEIVEANAPKAAIVPGTAELGKRTSPEQATHEEKGPAAEAGG